MQITIHARICLLLLILLIPGCKCNESNKAVITQTDGEVSIRSATVPTHAAAPGNRLRHGDILSTGVASNTTIEFLGGSIKVGPVTVLSLNAKNEIPTVSILGGKFSLAAARPRVFEIELPLGRIVPTEVPVTMTVKPLQGKLHLQSGAVSFTRRDGQVRLLTPGHTLVQVNKNQEISDEIPWRYSGVVLLSPARETKINRKKQGWINPRKEEFIIHGDLIRTGSEEAILQYLNRDQIFLSAGSQLQFPAAQKTNKADFTHYQLSSGHLTAITFCENKNKQHRIHVNKQYIDIICNRQRTKIEVLNTQDKQASVKVHQGQALINGSVLLEAGHAYDMEQQKRKKLFRQGVTAYTQQKTIVFTEAASVPVIFSAETQEAEKRHVLQLSRSNDFENIIYEESIAANQFYLDNILAGKYSFKVRPLDDPLRVTRGSLSIGPVATTSLQHSKHTIKASGVPQTLFYRKTLPAIEFQWESMATSNQYRVDIYSTENLETPYISRRVEGQKLLTQSGELGEGLYYWLIHSINKQGEELSVSQPYRFNIAFDGSANAIQLLSPEENEIVRSPVTLKAIVPNSFKLSVNGKAITVKRGQKAIKHNIAFEPGTKTIFLKAVNEQHNEVYYLVRNIIVAP